MLDKTLARGLTNALFRLWSAQNRTEAVAAAFGPLALRMGDAVDPHRNPRQRRAGLRDALKALRSFPLPKGSRRLSPAGADWGRVAFPFAMTADMNILPDGGQELGVAPELTALVDDSAGRRRYLDSRQTEFSERFFSLSMLTASATPEPTISSTPSMAIVGDHAIQRWYQRSGIDPKYGLDAVMRALTVADLLVRLQIRLGAKVSRTVVPAPGGAFVGMLIFTDRVGWEQSVGRLITADDQQHSIEMRLSSFFPTEWIDRDVMAAAERLGKITLALGPTAPVPERLVATLLDDLRICGLDPRFGERPASDALDDEEGAMAPACA